MSEMQDKDPREPRDTRSNTTTEPIRNEPVRNEPMAKEPVNNDPMPAKPQATRTTQPTQMELWPDMADFRRRFDAIQSEFIEDPKSAVRKAESLMQEAVDRITRSMHERMRSMHRDVDGKDGDTESLRMTMVHYRAMIDSMGGRRAA